MEKFFHLSEHNTNVKTEIMAGITTFMAMAYILFVNSNMFATLGISFNAIYIATAISAVIGTVLIGLLSNLPLAQASGMGLNAYFVYTVCLGFGFSYANALVMVLIDGIVFMILTVTGLRQRIFEGIPKSVRVAIPAGIGLFIAFIGYQNAAIVVDDGATLVNLTSFNLLKGTPWGTIMPVLITILTVIAIAIMSHRQVKGAVLWGILGGTAAYYLLGLTVPDFYANLSLSPMNPIDSFKEFGTQSFGKVFTEGFNFAPYIEANGAASFVLVLVTTALAFCMVDMFDTIGTLYGACARGNLLDKDGSIPNMNKAMMADAIATTAGAICGTSTVTTYVESSAGVAEGGRTGLSSMAAAAMFFIAMFLSPVAALIPSCATAAALIYVGVLMMNCVKDIDWLAPASAVPAFLTISVMAFTYNISYGIAFGIISSLIISVFTGKAKETKITTWIIAALFLAMFLLTH
ncbi:MAG: NCS2 family permease [Firmicutes bacterium]|nr:NCS2 family permease [Bacillota bacterium]